MAIIVWIMRPEETKVGQLGREEGAAGPQATMIFTMIFTSIFSSIFSMIFIVISSMIFIVIFTAIFSIIFGMPTSHHHFPFSSGRMHASCRREFNFKWLGFRIL